MRTLLFAFLLCTSFHLIPQESHAAKVGKFYVLNTDGTQTYVSPTEARINVILNKKVYFKPESKRPRKIEKDSVLFRELFK